MTYEVVFDVWQRLPQLAIGVVAAVALVLVVGAGLLWDIDDLIRWWRPVFGLGATCLCLQWLVVGEWPYVLVTAIVIGIMVVLARAPRSPADTLPQGSRRLLVGVFMLVLAAFQGLPMTAAIDLDRRLMDGQAEVVEGPVRIEGFVKSECLLVDGQRFCYSQWEISPGYNRVRYLFGALQDGTHVRLSVIDGMIVRLEVASTG
jgi:hypothetical protein